MITVIRLDQQDRQVETEDVLTVNELRKQFNIGDDTDLWVRIDRGDDLLLVDNFVLHTGYSLYTVPKEIN